MQRKFWPAATLSLLAFSCFAQADDIGMAVSPIQYVTNPNTGKDTGIGMSVQADWLYLQARQDGNEYVIQNTNPTSTTNYETVADAKNINGKYKSGVRATAQYDISGHDHWDIKAAYTYFKQTSNSSLSVKSGSEQLYPFLRHPANIGATAGLLTGDSVLDSSAKWSTKLSLVDVELGRDFKPQAATWFMLRPFVGVRWTKHDQSLAATYSNPTTPPTPIPTETITNSTNAKGVGLKFGTNLLFSFFENSNGGLGAYADFAVSILSMKFDTTQNTSYEPNPLTAAPAGPIGMTKANYHSGKVVSDIGAGLTWNMFLGDSKNMAIQILVGMEQQQWHNFNQFIRPIDATAKFTFARNHGDLFYRGFKIGAKFVF